ncbi:MAG: shikimate dehydrogenase [Gammaproteobacteria bacterium]|jgi:shikimate dehydrogenase
MANWFHISPDRPYFCVVGSPIDHSKSPQIHQAFAAQFDIDLRYEKIKVEQNYFADALKEFVAEGGRAMNVTVPHKEDACASADIRSERADLAGAANMISVGRDGETIADNSDGAGLIQDLRINRQLELRGSRVLLLGAGGAARGVVPSLLAQRPSELVVVNRSFAKAKELAERFGSLGPVRAAEYTTIGEGPYGLIVNATSLSLSGEVPPLDPDYVSANTWCYDMMYTSNGRTPFLDWCASGGAAGCSDGLGMLVEQAANAFSIWHGREPDTASVIDLLR